MSSTMVRKQGEWTEKHDKALKHYLNEVKEGRSNVVYIDKSNMNDIFRDLQ